MTRAGSALALLLALLFAPPSDVQAGDVASESVLCRITLDLEPEDPFVDQQVLYRLRIETRPEVRSVEWIAPPSFPGLRSERLPGRPDVGTYGSAGYRIREEHRALFPERAGEIAVGRGGLRCTAASQVLDVPVPAASLRVRPLPEAGRPADFTGLVGALRVERRAAPPLVAVGQALRVTVRLRGEGNLWDAPDPLPSDASFGGAEVFRPDPALDLVPGARLRVGRVFRYDVVPHETGTLRLSELRVSYFDPATGGYSVARAPSLDLEVSPARAPRRLPGPSPAAPTASPGAAPEGPAPWWVAAALAGVAACVVALVRLRRGRDATH